MVKVLVAFLGSILILSSLGLSQGVFAQNVGLSDSPHPSAQETYDLESLSAAAAAPGGGMFTPQPAGTDVNTMLGRNEPHVVVNPLNSANVAVSSVSPLLRLSLDGGATFPIVVSALLPLSQQNQIPQYFFCGDPSLTFDSQGRLFWSYLTCSFQPAPAPPNTLLDLSVVVLQVNPTTGATIGNAVDVTPGNFVDDKNWIAADANPLSAFADNLYIVWVRFDDNLRVRYSMSVDQGVNWTPQQAISAAGEGFTWPPHITVGPNGDVYANYPTDTCGMTGTVQVLRDVNGGTDLAAGNAVQKNPAFTSQQATVSCNVQALVDTFGVFAPIPQTDFWLQGSAAAYTITDPLIPGRIYVVGNDDPNNMFGNGDDGDVVMATSNDFGVNWAVSTITSGPSNSLQVMPTPAIDQNGNICVSWYDTRAGNTNQFNNFLLDLYVTFSTDGGVTFQPDFQINDVAFDPDANAPARFLGPPPTLRIGEYNGIAASNSLAYAAWTGNDASNMQEIFFDTFPCAIFAAIGGDMIQMETTSILAAGAQHTAAWMIPVIVSVIGIGIVIARKF